MIRSLASLAAFSLLVSLVPLRAARAQDSYGREAEDDDDDGQGQPGSYQGDFRSDPALAQTGEWIDTPEYGTVWRPTSVSDDWRPYYAGRWAFTDAGWAWMSDEPFGWAVYHYGRWAFVSNTGWVWLPGRVWAPAWVSWRWGDGYAGWCPLGPRNVFFQEPRVWVFVEQRNFLSPVQHYAVPIYDQQRLAILPPGPRAGPVAHAVERATGHGIRPMPIAEASTPRAAGQSGAQVSFYRPHIGGGPRTSGGGARSGGPAARGATGSGATVGGGSGSPRASSGQWGPRTGPAPRVEGSRPGDARSDFFDRKPAPSPRPAPWPSRSDEGPRASPPPRPSHADEGPRASRPPRPSHADEGPRASPPPRPSHGAEAPHDSPRPPVYFGGVPSQGIVERNAKPVPPPPPHPHASDSKK